MTDGNKLLQEALELLVPWEDYGYTFEGMRMQMLNFQGHLKALTVEERRLAFETANARIDSIGTFSPRLAHLWVFSHPTLDVFEAFLADSPVGQAYADFLLIMFLSTTLQSGKRRASQRKQIRYYLRHMPHDAELLAAHYTRILLKWGGGWIDFFKTRKRNAAGRVVFLAEPRIDSMAMAAYALLKRKLVTAGLADAKSKLPSSLLGELMNIFDPTTPLSERVELPAVLDDFFDNLSVTGFSYLPNGQWRPFTRAQLEDLLLRAVRMGTWPRFVLEQAPQPHTVTPTGVKVSLRREMIDRVVQQEHNVSLALLESLRRVTMGMLPIGLKIHCPKRFVPGMHYLTRGFFSIHNDGTCFNMPPVGNMSAVRQLFAVIEERSGTSFLNNPDFSIQVCSPGMLTPRNAAILGASFCLTADPLRRFDFSNMQPTHMSYTGKRLVIYGAGVLDTDFSWWGSNKTGTCVVGTFFEQFKGKRTDVLGCKSLQDIENINLIATLLVHSQYQGYFRFLGERFIAEVGQILNDHHLSGVLDAPWVRTSTGNDDKQGDEHFMLVLEDLTAYALAEATEIYRAQTRGSETASQSGILYQMHELLVYYRNEVVIRAHEAGVQK